MQSAKVWAVSEDGEIEYVSVTSNTLDGAMEVMHKSFFAYEKVCIAVELNRDPKAAHELDELTLNTIKNGVSVVAVEKKTGKVVAVAVNKLQVKGVDQTTYFKKYIESCTSPSAKAVLEFMITADGVVDLFELCQADCLLEVMFLATLPEFGKKGIAKKLCEATIELGRKLHSGDNVRTSLDGTDLPLDAAPSVIFGILTSFKSQSIAKQLGFVTADETSYEKYFFEGKSFASRIGSDTQFVTLQYKFL